MSHWEKDAIFSGNIPQLKFYKRYIDDIIIWAGSKEYFLHFLAKIGENRYGISFSATFDNQSINFLGLVIFKDNHQLSTKTHPKEVDRNGHIPPGEPPPPQTAQHNPQKSIHESQAQLR